MKNRREKKKEQKERNSEWVFNPANLGQFVISYDLHVSYGEPLILLPPPKKKIYDIISKRLLRTNLRRALEQINSQNSESK